MKYDRLFSPVAINKMELKNRIIMPALHHKYTPDGYATEQLCEYYNARAEGGAGLIIVGGCRFADSGGTIGMIDLSHDKYVESYLKFTGGIHQRDAKVCAQLYHSGRYARSKNNAAGRGCISASATYSKYSRETSRAMTLEEIAQIQDDWAEGAARAKRAGFDAVEIIACSGYLIPQFLSRLTNHRTDRYGGSLENRCRFAKEVVEKVRAAVGPGYPLLMRIAGNDFMAGGGAGPEAVAFARAMEAAGIDLLNVTGGWHESSIPQVTGDLPPAGYTYLAHAVKKAVSIPVAASNRLSDPMVAEEVLALEKADMVCLGRVLVADPDWPRKVREGREDELRKCVACNQGCLANSFFEKPLDCLLNGMCGREHLFRGREKAGEVRRILVVGGGPGGAEFAIRAAQRGHRVTLWEKEARTGGQLPLVAVPSGKGEFLGFMAYQETMLKKGGVEVVCNKTATADDVAAAGFDVVVTATGVTPTRISLPCDEGKIPVLTAREVLAGERMPGKNVVVVGGGAVGCEVAHVLSARGALSPEELYFLSIHKAEPPETIEALLNTSVRSVSIVEILPAIGTGFDPGAGWPLLKDLRRLNVAQYPDTAISAVGDGIVTLEKTRDDGEKERFTLPCDTIVLAVGSKADDALYRALEGKVPVLYNLGDSKTVGKIIHAIHDAVDLAYEIG